MVTQFEYNWNGAKNIFVEVVVTGYNPETEELIYPRIQFFPSRDATVPWSMYYSKKEFDIICRIAYTIFSSEPVQKNK